jgi:site-specific DNA-methyltransferase (adenine-specific)
MIDIASITNTVIHADCLDIMRELPDKCIDLVLTDPPYFEIKGDFDFEYDSFNQFLEFFEKCAVEWKRILKQNGSLYCFGHAKRIAYKQTILDKYFNLENNITWWVYDRQTNKGVESFRCFAPVTERILFYSNEIERTGLEEIKLNVDNFKSLRNYFKQYQEAIGLNKKQIIKIIGQSADHCFRHDSSQWDLPTPETYSALGKIPLKKLFQRREYEDLRREYEDLRREYEDLRREYEDLRREYEDLRRPFNNIFKLTDVMKFSQEGHLTGKINHDTVKPLKLINSLILTSTKPSFVVLDPFAGSGTTAIACLETGRNYILIEKEKDYIDIINKRIADWKEQGRMFCGNE